VAERVKAKRPLVMSDAEIVKEFLVESYENLDRLDQDLVALEKAPTDRDTLASIFRTIHTIKGTSGFLAFNQLAAVTHVGETLLARLRDGVLALSPEITTALLAMVDAVREMLGSIEDTGKEGERNDDELISNLTRLLDSKEEAKPVPEPTPAKEETQTNDLPQPTANIGAILIKQGAAKVSEVYEAMQQQHAGDPRHLGEILVERGAVKPEDVVDALHIQQQARGQGASESTVRVDVSELDRLMNRVGELVLLRNQIVQYSNSMEDSRLLETSQRLSLLTTELQEAIMKTRMQPIGSIWSRFPRTVRDVALGCGKQVRIEMQGQDTELDKTIIEAIKDPLTHLVRNAVDHGIERPELRRTAGKKDEGLVLLRAFHEGGQVHVEVVDDGVGLDYEKLRNKAIEKEIITANQAARMTEREITDLIFVPGLSTTEKVTKVSGRGVGLDVVKTNVEKIGGTVEVQSTPGQGTTVRMKIPITLAIIPALVVTTAAQRYVIPQVSLLELRHLEGEEIQRSIQLIHGTPVYRLRERLLPLVYLGRELNVDAEEGFSQTAAGPNEEIQRVDIVVLRTGGRQFGLVVDEINDTQEIVVKPLTRLLKSINLYAGAAIMDDGKVALILDVLGLAQRAHVTSDVCDRRGVEKPQMSPELTEGSQRNSVVLFQYGEKGRMAIELALVARLQEFPRETVEFAASQEVVQYRGQIMPLLRVSDLLQCQPSKEDENRADPLQVVVCSDQQRTVGLVVDRILDIVEESFVIDRGTGRKGVLGSAVIQKRVTDILDVPALIAAAAPSQVSVGAHA
jgi:two-component system, chemotaxis family, sensor kinase CheA